MRKIGIADYGMNVWYGGFMDYEQRMQDIKAIGYDGIERLTPIDAADALNKATTLIRHAISQTPTATMNPANAALNISPNAS